MRTSIKILLLSGLLVCGLATCNNVEFFSTGPWKIEHYHYNGVDSTTEYMGTHENYLLNLRITHAFTETQILNETAYAVTGTWEVSDDIKTLRLVDSLYGTREFQIKEASTTSLILEKGVEEWGLKRP